MSLKRYPLRTIVTVSLLIAMEIVLSRFLSINTQALKIGFGFVPIAVCGMMFGPVASFVAGGLSDFLGAVLFPIGPYTPTFTVSAALTGLFLGLILRKNVKLFPQITAAALINAVGISYLLNSYWIMLLYGTPYNALLLTRLLQCGVLIALYFILLPLLKKLCDILKKGYFTYNPKRQRISTAYDAESYIHSYTRLGSKPGLERTQALFERIGSPEKSLPCVHVAGTNGKGSTSAMIASMLTAAGYKTGLYTSPYVMYFAESFRINGRNVCGRRLARACAAIKKQADAMSDHPTVFELKTALAFKIFTDAKCDVAVIEVGMGGRLDSTNVIPSPLVSVITNIGLDHTKELGDTLPLIAYEKAGIIKRGCPLAVYGQSSEVLDVFKARANELGSPIRIADFSSIRVREESPYLQRFDAAGYEDLSLRLVGENQRKNCATALAAVGMLGERGFAVNERAVRKGLLKTRWPARFEVVKRGKTFVIDGGHNPQCAASVAENLTKYFGGEKIVFILASLADKDYANVLKEFYPLAAAFYTLTPHSPRALGASALAEIITNDGFPATPCRDAREAVRLAKKDADDNIICVTGSLYMVGEARKALRLR